MSTETSRAPLLAPFRISSLVVAGFAATTAVLSMQLPVGTIQQPGAGMWPLIVSVGVGIAALVLLFTERDASDYEPLTKRSLVVIVGFLLMAGFIVMFANIGFTLASLVFSVVWLRFLAKERWAVVIVGAIGFTVAFVVIFVIVLKVPVPHDPVVSFITTGRL